MISLIYSLIYLVEPKPAWAKDSSRKTLRKKTTLNVDEIYNNKAICFSEVYNEIENMKFADKPDYPKITFLLKKIILEDSSSGIQLLPGVFNFDWISDQDNNLPVECSFISDEHDIFSEEPIH